MANEGRVYALYNYSANEQDELSFEDGEELLVLKREDATEREWWWAQNKNGETGYIPRNLFGVGESFLPNQNVKPQPNDRNMPTQHIATLLGATCCLRLATVLRHVGCCWLKFDHFQI